MYLIGILAIIFAKQIIKRTGLIKNHELINYRYIDTKAKNVVL
jgi:hypothetical protein